MKKILTAASLFISLSAVAQIKLLPAMPKFDPDFLKKDITLQYSHWWTYPKATLTGHTPQGNIYALPADKMPCLVADIRQIAHISNARTPFQNSLMLNPFKKEELIPEQ